MPVIDKINYNGTTYDLGGGISGGSNSPSDVEITPTTTSVYSITGVGSVPTLTFSQDSTDTKQLNISWDAGAVPTRSQVTGLWNGYTSAVAAAQVFTGSNSVQSVGDNTF